MASGCENAEASESEIKILEDHEGLIILSGEQDDE